MAAGGHYNCGLHVLDNLQRAGAKCLPKQQSRPP
jgi:hypothetical protein